MDLALAMQRHRAGIDAGVAWVTRCVQRYPALQEIVGPGGALGPR